jgi:hypothetical protein
MIKKELLILVTMLLAPSMGDRGALGAAFLNHFRKGAIQRPLYASQTSVPWKMSKK